MYDICIVGAGASGMTAAIRAKELNPTLSVLVVEKKSLPGRKILATGNGKCNLSNISCSHYAKTQEFFNGLGVLSKTDEQGRVYPYTEDAKAVETALEGRMKFLGIELLTDTAVLEIVKDGHFVIKTSEQILEAEKLLIACGGKAGPSFGTTGDGYKLARTLGHTVKKQIPVLTAVDVEGNVTDLAGIRVKGKVSLEYKREVLFEEIGEIQFTKTGVSGICIFNLSRYLLIPDGESRENGFRHYRIILDFLPHMDDVEDFLLQRSSMEGITAEEFLNSMVRKPIETRILKGSKGDIKEMARVLKRYILTPKSVKGWEFAQVTKGGVELTEINLTTMESTIVRNLFFAGEVIDFDGPCGGFNLQNAWETGLKAGEGMANV